MPPLATIVVVLRLAGAPADTARVATVVTELLARETVTPRIEDVGVIDPREVVTPVPTDDPPLARIWIELGVPERATIYVADQTWERVLVRGVPLEAGVDEVAREEIAHILEATIESLLAGQAIGRPREEVRAELALDPATPPPPAPYAPPAPRPARSRPRGPSLSWGLGAFYDVQGFSDDPRLTQGPGLRALVSTRGGPFLSALGAWRFPVHAQTDGAGVRLDAASLRAEAGVRVAAGRVVEVWPAAGAGLDLVHVTPQAARAGFTAASTRWTSVPFMRLSVTVALRFLGRARILAGLGLDVDLENTVYTFERDGKRETALDPWSARPSVSAGFYFE